MDPENWLAVYEDGVHHVLDDWLLEARGPALKLLHALGVGRAPLVDVSLRLLRAVCELGRLLHSVRRRGAVVDEREDDSHHLLERHLGIVLDAVIKRGLHCLYENGELGDVAPVHRARV